MEWIYCSGLEGLTVLPACLEAPGLRLLAMKHLFCPITSSGFHLGHVSRCSCAELRTGGCLSCPPVLAEGSVKALGVQLHGAGGACPVLPLPAAVPEPCREVTAMGTGWVRGLGLVAKAAEDRGGCQPLSIAQGV